MFREEDTCPGCVRRRNKLSGLCRCRALIVSARRGIVDAARRFHVYRRLPKSFSTKTRLARKSRNFVIISDVEYATDP